MGLSKYAPRRLASLEREVQAVELRKRGYTFLEIGKALIDEEHPQGISRQAATNLVKRAFKKLNAESAKTATDALTLEVARLDKYLKGLEKKIEDGDVNAIALALKLSERRSRMMGLDRPVQVETKSTIESSVSEDQLKRMAEALVNGKA